MPVSDDRHSDYTGVHPVSSGHTSGWPITWLSATINYLFMFGTKPKQSQLISAVIAQYRTTAVASPLLTSTSDLLNIEPEA